jgi:hypothetical protein
MDSVSFRTDGQFFSSFSQEGWIHVLCYAIKNIGELTLLSLTCHSLRTVAHDVVVIKTLFQKPAREAVIGAKPANAPIGAEVPIGRLLTFLETHVSGEKSKELSLDFSEYPTRMFDEELIKRIFKSFPHISTLNLCEKIYLFPLPGLYCLEKAEQQISLPPNLTVTVWQNSSENEAALQKKLQEKYSTLKIIFTPLPPPQASVNDKPRYKPRTWKS